MYIKIIIVIFLIIFEIFFIFFVIQNKIIYKSFLSTGEIKIGETMTLVTSDNQSIDVHFIDNNSDTDIYFFHGAIMKPKVHNKICNKLTKNNKFNIFALIYRGYSNLYKNASSSEIGIMLDIKTFHDYISKNRNTSKKIIIGHSLGCAASLYFLSLFNSTEQFLCVLENPFYSFKTVLYEKWYHAFISFLVVSDWPNYLRIEKINKENCKFLFIISGKDEYISNKNTEKLLNHLKNNSYEKFFMENATHFDCGKYEEYYETIFTFIEKNIK
ncbi:hypothetical protein CWI38_0218p0050 [Hamiltosporidium tvaerminnensis]|uniref:Alpha/beta hydrolase n=1 Tax=Hamiltosporidium tvaerminnensis TaxID=1176355 RepID=A0A4Q9LQ96_9MICR|nr:hypothetical protein CWI38_1629p0020 [Hamiltosporidium tvaerminnensis]TBU19127.1 hypothetical protein CWI38_0218p0050 [Hamiltosporidium tvaerminnensis]